MLVVALGLLPAAAAFCVIISEGRAYHEQAHAYRRAGQVFARAKQVGEALPASDDSGWRELILALGQEALTENAAWLQTHRQHQITNKAGG